MVRTALHLGHARGKMMYELRPDLFPQGYLTPAETELWSRFFAELKKK